MSLKAIAFITCCLTAQAFAQQLPFTVQKPQAPLLVRSYKAPGLPPVELRNSEHLYSLIRAGNLYLTVQDAIALAIENNLDLEIDRYGPLLAEWQVQRAKAGGPLRGVTQGNTLVNQITSGQGVLGSLQSVGLIANTNNNSNNANGAIVSQIGPVTQNLDPVLVNATVFSHITTPQPNRTVSQTDALVDTSHLFQTFVQQGLLSGGYIQVAANESYLKENAPTDVLNPSVAPLIQVYFRHNLLNAFGAGVNSRFIQVAEKNVTASSEAFRSQLLNLVAGVLNSYWDLVGSYDDLKVKEGAEGAAEKFYDDIKQEIQLGALAKVEVYRAEAELSTRRQQLAIAQASVRQQENLLKNMLSRDGLGDPILDAVEVVPLDRMQVPPSDSIPALRELVATALDKRPDVELAKINDVTSEISARGTANGLLPTLSGITALSARGLAGVATPQPPGLVADKYYSGGLGNALGQIFRRDFPTNRAGLLFIGTLENRVAQGDYGIEQLQLRQGDLIERRNMNQIVVDISNQVIALRQARARYTQAVDSRNLQQQLLEKEQQKFSLGTSTINDLVTAQDALVTAQAAEVGALTGYIHARVGMDQATGETLEVNRVSVPAALRNDVQRQSKAPGGSPASH